MYFHFIAATASDCEPAPLPVDDNALLSQSVLLKLYLTLLITDYIHAPTILDAIDSVVNEWERLGLNLGISNNKLKHFKHNSRDQVEVCRKDMIHHWIDTKCATCNKLKSALERMGERGIVDDIQRLQTAE